MKTVQQLLQAKADRVISVPPTATVYEALTLMARHDIGALIVLDGETLVGMFSERDYSRKVVLHGKASKDVPVAAIMTTHIVSVSPEHTVEDCMSLMTDKRVRHLPVLAGPTVAGVVSIGDVVKALLDEQQFTIRQLENYISP